MPSALTTAALLAAMQPLAAYVARTPAGNGHADKIAAAVDSVADYVDETEAENETPPGLDWEYIASRFIAHMEPTTPPSALMIRTRAHLDQPHMKARAALPLAERIRLASVTSYHL